MLAITDLRILRDWARPTAVSARLAGLAPTPIWRDLIAACVAVLVVVTTSGGLVRQLPWLLIPLVVAIAVSLIASSVARAGLTAAAATALGLLIGPVTPFVALYVPVATRIQEGLISTLVAATLATALRYLLPKLPRAALALNWLAVAIIVFSLWSTTLTLNTRPTYDAVTQRDKPSLNAQLESDPATGDVANDQVFLWRLSKAASQGQPYYSSFREIFIDWSGSSPSSPTNHRFPLIAYVLGMFPGTSVVIAFLVTASLALCCVPVFVRGFVKQPLALPAVCALASYFLFFATRMHLFTSEVWSVLLGIFSLTALALSAAGKHRRMWVVVSVVGAVLAVLVRETSVFLLPAGLASAALIASEDRRFDVIAWSTGCLFAATALAVHFWYASSMVDPNAAYDQLNSGGVRWAVESIFWATQNLGGRGWLAVVLAALGLTGMALIPDARVRWFALFTSCATLFSFLLVANTGQQVTTGVVVNYWGTIVVPYLYLCVPIVFLMLPATAVGVLAPSVARAGRVSGKRSRKARRR